MNLFNRIIVVLLLIALILVSAAVIVLPKQALTVATGFVGALGSYISVFQGWVLMTIALLGLIALSLVLLWLEVRRPVAKTVRVEKISGGEVRVAVESVARRLQYNLDQLPQVLSVKPRVTARGKRVDITLDIETTQDVNIPAKTEEMSQITRSVVEEQMGLRLGKMVVSVRHTAIPSAEGHKPISLPKPPAVGPEEATPAAPPPESEPPQA